MVGCELKSSCLPGSHLTGWAISPVWEVLPTEHTYLTWAPVCRSQKQSSFAAGEAAHKIPPCLFPGRCCSPWGLVSSSLLLSSAPSHSVSFQQRAGEWLGGYWEHSKACAESSNQPKLGRTIASQREESPITDNVLTATEADGYSTASEVSAASQLRAHQSEILSCLTHLSWSCKLALPCAFRLWSLKAFLSKPNVWRMMKGRWTAYSKLHSIIT